MKYVNNPGPATKSCSAYALERINLIDKLCQDFATFEPTSSAAERYAVRLRLQMLELSDLKLLMQGVVP